jgi:hypothetical protein
MTDAKVPISIATEAGSIQVSFCGFLQTGGLAAGEADEDQAKYGNVKLRMSTMRNASFSFIGLDRHLADLPQPWLNPLFASSIGHNHGLFDEI